MPEPLLPTEFADARAVRRDVVPGDRAERYAQRMASSMDEMQAFYDAAFPRIQEALAYCDKFPLDDLPDDATRLLQLVYSTIMVAMCVEIWHQPKVIDSADARARPDRRAAAVTGPKVPSCPADSHRDRLRRPRRAGRGAGLRAGVDLRLGPAVGGPVRAPRARRRTDPRIELAQRGPDPRATVGHGDGVRNRRDRPVSRGRFRACFGTGFTARLALGRRPMTLAALADYVTALRRLLAGETADRGRRRRPGCSTPPA